jgi:DTW domain-containing protein YfiP
MDSIYNNDFEREKGYKTILMPARRKSRFRCSICRMRQTLCICAVLPRFQLETRIVVFMHCFEAKTTTNTARLACMALPNSEIRMRGRPHQPVSGEGLQQAGGSSLVLYPSETAVELTPEYVQSLKRPITLIVPDGSWRQAARTVRREPVLNGIPNVKLPAGPTSMFQLRRAPQPHFISTFESIARSIGVLEGAEQGPKIQEALEKAFSIMVERTMWTRGLISLEKCKYPIPPEALEPIPPRVRQKVEES